MFEGVLTALVTPFKEGELDEPALRLLVEEQIEAGINGLCPCGSTGESATLSHEEHQRVVEVVVDAASGRVPVVAGTGSNNTREAIELTQHAKEAGADGALLISPYYNKPTQEGLVAHFEAIAKATSFPLVFYNIPGRTASNMNADTQTALARVEHIVGVKESSGDLEQVAHVIGNSPADFCLLSGDDSLTLPLMALGGNGVITTTGNVAPERMAALVHAMNDGDIERAREVHYELLPLFDALFAETNPIPVKAAVALQGHCSDEIRPPMTRPSADTLAQLDRVLRQLGLLS